LFGQKGLVLSSSRCSHSSLVRISISGSTRDHTSYAFDTAVVTEKFPIRCHNPLNVGPREVEQLFGRYYTEKQMREAVITRTKKAITKDVVEPHKKKLTPVQYDRILTLLAKLMY
jgi:hypothetical protein